MTAKFGSVWAIDIGNNSLKALRLSNESGVLEVTGFDNIQHGKILTGMGVSAAEREELTALSLRTFVEGNDLSRDDIIVSVPSQNSFARFVKLPPVEQKRIPEIVKFEAGQQIPFDINEVQWDWQMMSEPGSAEVEVGIFAIKNEVVTAELEHFARESIKVGYVQMVPMALYNYLLYDRPDLASSDSRAAVVLNIGAENTDLVVCTKQAVWQRTIPMGGNAFTRAIADTFKLNFEKAEKLKRTAPMSKYARQILQAMKPVFTDLASEIQRSIGFYNNSNPNVKIGRIVALGGGTKMRGLLQYLQQSLQVPIERPDSFKQLGINSSVSAAKFHESVCDFAVVYGLGIQALGLGRIGSNLLPKSVARSMAWAAKSKWFAAAAALFLLVSVLAFARALVDRTSYAGKSGVRRQVSQLIGTARRAEQDLGTIKSESTKYEAAIQKQIDLFRYRDVIPTLQQTLLSVLPDERNTPEQRDLYRAFKNGDVETVMKTPREQRKQIFVTSMSVRYTTDVETAGFTASGFELGADVTGGGLGGGGAPYDDKAMMQLLYGKAGASKYALSPSAMRSGILTAKTTEAPSEGFVVTVAGYSPYKDLGKLMDPAGTGDDKNKWGIITRLMRLDEALGRDVPFELYKKTEITHFELKTGDVDLGSDIPKGIGEKIKRSQSGEEVLIDPMTKEVISKVAVLDEYGKKKLDRSGKPEEKVNDHWFVLNAKLKWKKAGKAEEQKKSEQKGAVSAGSKRNG